MEDNRKKALVAALSQIEKQFGKGSVMRLGDAGATYDVETVPTGSLGGEWNPERGALFHSDSAAAGRKF